MLGLVDLDWRSRRLKRERQDRRLLRAAAIPIRDSNSVHHLKMDQEAGFVAMHPSSAFTLVFGPETSWTSFGLSEPAVDAMGALLYSPGRG